MTNLQRALGACLLATGLLLVGPGIAQATALQADNAYDGGPLPVFAYTPVGYELEYDYSDIRPDTQQVAAATMLDPGATNVVHKPDVQTNDSKAASTMVGGDNPSAKARQGLVRGTVATDGTPVEMTEAAAQAVRQQQILQQQHQQTAIAQDRTQKLTAFIKNYNKRLSYEQANVIAEAIIQFSAKYQVDFRIVTGVIAVESGFRSNAVSSSGAIGMGQLKPSTAKWLGVVNPYDPIDNIAGSTRYISYLLKKYNGNVDKALSGYFQGPGATDRNGITPASRYYLMKVNRALTPLVPLFNR